MLAKIKIPKNNIEDVCLGLMMKHHSIKYEKCDQFYSVRLTCDTDERFCDLERFLEQNNIEWEIQ